jgi:hypothetical protein
MRMSKSLARRNEALETMDMDYARELMPNATSDNIRLAAMHKARYECTLMTDSLRHESRKWLEDHKFTRLNSVPWPPKDEELPE